MSQDPRDILRSLHYHVAQHLLDHDGNYDIRLAIEEQAWDRPCAVIQAAGPIQLQNQGRRIAVSTRPFAAYIYPAQGSTPKDAELEAQRVEAIVAQIFQVGGQGGYPMRIPLFDWEEIGDDEGLPGEAEPVAWMSVMDATTDHKADPDDETMQTIFMNFRVKWRDIGEPYPETETLEEVKVTAGEVG